MIVQAHTRRYILAAFMVDDHEPAPWESYRQPGLQAHIIPSRPPGDLHNPANAGFISPLMLAERVA